MDALLVALEKVTFVLVGRDSPLEMWSLAIGCVLMFWLSYPRISIRLGGRGKVGSLSLIPGVLLLLLAAASVMAFTKMAPIFQAAAAGVVLLLLVVPLTMKTENIPYFKAFLLYLSIHSNHLVYKRL